MSPSKESIKKALFFNNKIETKQKFGIDVSFEIFLTP